MINAVGSNNNVTSTNKKEDVQSLFATELEKTQTKDEIKADELNLSKKLLADILSMFSTGLSVSELESIDKLVEEFRKRIKEEKPNKEELTKMMEELEQKIAKLQKSVTGEAIKEGDKTSDKTDIPSFDILMRIQEQLKSSMEEANKLKIGTLTKNNRVNNTEEFELLKELKSKS